MDEGGEELPVFVGAAGVGFALVPDDSGQCVVLDRGDHAVVESGGDVLEGGASLLGRHADSCLVFPVAFEADFLVAGYDFVGFVFYESGVSRVADEPYGDLVGAFF